MHPVTLQQELKALRIQSCGPQQTSANGSSCISHGHSPCSCPPPLPSRQGIRAGWGQDLTSPRGRVVSMPLATQNHRITGRSGLEGTSVGHLVQSPCRSRVTYSRQIAGGPDILCLSGGLLATSRSTAHARLSACVRRRYLTPGHPKKILFQPSCPCSWPPGYKGSPLVFFRNVWVNFQCLFPTLIYFCIESGSVGFSFYIPAGRVFVWCCH